MVSPAIPLPVVKSFLDSLAFGALLILARWRTGGCILCSWINAPLVTQEPEVRLGTSLAVPLDMPGQKSEHLARPSVFLCDK